ncbi:MAG TPA: AAA domain-containing protein [Ignavibacteriaceae bacterium]|nr:AAA domain-containing protein [Ignavibacteriaceae bacterium]
MLRIISSYLDYLRDVSRKIISRSGFEQVLLDKSKKNPSFANQILEYSKSIQISNNSYSHFDEILKHIERNPDKQLFIGFGFICGQRDGRTFAGPLLFTECDISRNGDIIIDVDYSSLNLNYDLVSSLLGFINIAEDEEYNASYEKEISLVDKIEADISDIYSDEKFILSKIQKYCQQFSITQPRGTTVQIIYNFSVQFAQNIFFQLNECIEQFADIDLGSDFDFKDELLKHKENNSVFKQKLKFYDTTFYFVNVIPDQLSTFIALNKLSSEITEQNFGNPTLEKLLLNSLTNNKKELTQIGNDEITEIIKNQIPLNLSQTQKRAIKNAFECELSYIQGPPGTGKSYTISAIILTALFLGKKVLLISQKKPALEVVKEKTEPFFSNPSEKVNGLIYYDLEARKNIREQIKELLNNCQDLRAMKREINRIKENLSTKTEELNWHLSKLKDLEKNLAQTLHSEYEFKQKNDSFLKYLRDVFSKNYHSLDNNHKFTFISEVSKIDFILNQLSKFYSLPYKNSVTKLYEKKITNLLLDKFHLNIDFLLNDFPSYAESILKLNKYFSETEIKKKKIRYSCEKLRNEISYYKNIVENIQKEIIRQKFKYDLYSFLMNEDYRRELGKFSAMLRFTKTSEIQSRMDEIDFGMVSDLIPFWAAEIRHLGRLFPMKPHLFDLVVVDEASQVNLAEVLPAFYRGKSICIVGDHKQLNVRSTGIGFQLSKRFDILTWQRYNAYYLNYVSAKSKNLTVTDASILDFIMSEYNNIIPPSVMLDEHFRSLPQLANFTNTFYKDLGGLKIMTETCEKVHTKSFIWIKIEGKRNENKEIKEEANKVIEIIKTITAANRQLNFSDSLKLPEQLQGKILSVGIIAMMRNQCNLIQSFIDEKIDFRLIDKHKIMVGTPEEFQGNERDVIIFSLGLDENCRYSIGHYQNAQRLNVATSRARLLTIFIYSSIPNNFNRIISYLKYFKGELNTDDVEESEENIVPSNFSNWTLNINAYESDFERQVFVYLDRYIKQKTAPIKIYNQVQSCGQKRLDFILYNEANKKSVAVEVDGSYHFLDNQYGNLYSQEHIERIETLTRAGWKIINTPYYKWYKDGWLCDENNEIFNAELRRIYSELDKYIL